MLVDGTAAKGTRGHPEIVSSVRRRVCGTK
jgi:hypothetical protein